MTVVAARIVQVGLGSFASFVLIGPRTIGPQQVSEVNKFKGLAVKTSLARALMHKGIFVHCQNTGSRGSSVGLSACKFQPRARPAAAVMSATKALRVARAAEVSVIVDGEGLVFEANAEPPQAVLDTLSRNKPAIIDLLLPGPGGWTVENWRTYFDERCTAASNNGLPSQKAAELALACCATKWMDQRTASFSPGRCAWCGRSQSASAVVLPFGTEPGTHAWLHAECWTTRHQARRAKAMVALTQMGIGRQP